MNVYVADFEITVRNDTACVWLFSLVNIYNLNEIYNGYDISDFLKIIVEISPNKIFFHNLKFDGTYILDYLLRMGYVYSDKKKLKNNEFNSLIGEQGEFYSISLMGKNNKITILDSLKIFNFSVDTIAKSFKLDVTKGEIDYNKYRPYGYIPGTNEIDYVNRDTIIVSKALKQFIEEGFDKITIASNALNEFKKTLNIPWKYVFPILEKPIDLFCRKAYKGGYTYVNPKFRNKIVGKGKVYDVNSMYPWALYYCDMPIGEPIYFSGNPPKDKIYICRIYVEKFSLKKGYLPTIQIKNNFKYIPTDYIESGEETEIYLTNIDYKLFIEHYNVYNCEILEGYYFESRNDLFRPYIDRFMEMKKNNTGGLRQIAKLFLNGLYGKFGSTIDKISKIPYLDEITDTVKFKRTEPKETEPIYIPISIFVTSYARDNIIRSAQNEYERFLYCDTDSLHLIGFDEPKINIDSKELGYYKLESTFKKAIYLKPKMYSEITREYKKYIINYKNKHINCKSVIYVNNIKCCGMSKNIVKSGKVTFNNFRLNSEFYGKLVPKIIKGGAILQETTFTIK